MKMRGREWEWSKCNVYILYTPVIILCLTMRDESVTEGETSRVKRWIHPSARKYNIVCESSVNIVILYRDEIIEEIVNLNLELIKCLISVVSVYANSITMKAIQWFENSSRKFLIYINEKLIISIYMEILEWKYFSIRNIFNIKVIIFIFSKYESTTVNKVWRPNCTICGT